MKFAIVVSRFNEMVTGPMLEACLKGFREKGQVPLVYKVPGAVEIPVTVQAVIEAEKPDVVVTLGCLILGETDHYSAICSLVTDSVRDLSLRYKTPIVFEVLMTDTYQKAEERIEKGYHAAETALEMAEFMKTIVSSDGASA